MNSKSCRFTVFVIALVLASLACGGGAKVAPTPALTATPRPTATPAVKLGQEQRADEYGFVFRPIPDYQVDTAIGVQMLAPGADTDTGPAFMLVGGEPPAKDITAETLIAAFNGDGMEQGEPKPITVDGVSGLVVDLTRPAGNLSGRAVAVIVKPGQEFMMFGMAPQEQWDKEIAVLFDAVLSSVKFVEVVASASPTEVVAEAPTQAPMATAEAPKPSTALGEDRHSDEGGFTFKAIPDYEVTDDAGQVQMMAPDGDTDLGPVVLMMTKATSKGTTAEETLATLESDELILSETRPITVDGAEGVVADFTRQGGDVMGGVVVVSVTPTRQFIMLGGAPKARWESELSGQFQALLEVITFFEPLGGVEPGSNPASELRQWATSAKASSAFGDNNWGAKQATGAPNVTACGDNGAAWASSGKTGVEWIELTYATPINPLAVNIHQSYNPGQIVKVELRDTAGNYHGVYTGKPQKGTTCPVTLEVPVSNADYLAVGVKITIDQTAVKDWAEIDAVELVGTGEGEAPAAGEASQWAAEGKASSAFGDDNTWGAKQATGKPNVTACGDNGAAWASAGKTGVEWIELTYVMPVIPAAVNIYQSYNPGQIVKVELRDTAGKYHVVYTGKPQKSATCPATLEVQISTADYVAEGVKITIDQSAVKDWAEIDAVELVGMLADGSGYAPSDAVLDPKTGLPVMEGAANVLATETTLNYSVKTDLAAARAFYLAELPKLGWLLDLDEKGKCRDNDRCMGWHGGYDDPATTTFFFLQGDHAYLTLNFIDAKGSLNVVLGVDPTYKK